MRHYIILLLLYIALISNGTNLTPLDNRSRALVDETIKTYSLKKNIFNNQKNTLHLKVESSAVDTLYYPVIMKISNDSVVNDLKNLGTVIMRQRDEFLLACIPFSKLDTISRLPLINQINISTKNNITLDNAKLMSNVDKIHTAIELPQAYTGKGVVIGISDIGFDPSHPSFNNERLRRLVHYEGIRAMRYDMSTNEDIATWTTDDSTEWHACHVAGILSGSPCDNNYYGIATDADMVITTSNLYDMAILAGVEDVVEYAHEIGAPAVVNLSVGHHLGPHDGTSLFNQYLDRIGQEAIICISAGNEGYKNDYISFDAENDGDELRTFVYNNIYYDGIKLNGAIDLWSRDSQDFLIALTIYDRITGEFVYTSPFIGSNNGNSNSWGIASSVFANNNDISIPLFEKELTGSVRIYTSKNLENNRYNAYATIDVTNHQLDGALGRYCIGFIARCNKGTHIDAYADGNGVFFHSLEVNGFTAGNPSRSISDLACGKNIIVVGACNSRNTSPKVSGKITTHNFNIDEVARFSSYGTLDDGRVLPHFCAPGNMVVAPMNSYFSNMLNEDVRQELAAKTTINGDDYYWISECGTSMASPHAAGIIACWLQADPTLTVADVIEIAQSTARKDFSDFPNPQWGAGCIDAHAGLIKVLNKGGVGNTTIDYDNKIIFSSTGRRQFHITISGVEINKSELYSTTGQLVLSQNGPDINATSLPIGIYIIKVTHNKGESINRIILNH